METSTVVEPNLVKLNIRGHFIQYSIAFSATLIVSSGAMVIGWTSPSLPILLGENSPIPITKDQGSWIVALLIVGVLASFPYAWIMDRFGRKFTLILSSIPLIIAWILIIFAESIELLYIARILSGLAIVGSMYCPIYLGEIASDNIRGSIGTLTIVMSKAGILYVYAIGPYVSIQMMASLAIIPPIIFLLIFVWCPESPYFLIKQNQRQKAYKSLLMLRGFKNKNNNNNNNNNNNDNAGGGDDVTTNDQNALIVDELNQIVVSVKKSLEHKTTYTELFKKTNRKSLIIVMGLEIGQQLTGSFIITAYAQMIFDDIKSNLNASEASILLGCVQLISSVVALSFVDRWGRRPLLILSSLGVSLCHMIVAIYFLIYDKYLQSTDDSLLYIHWIPVISIMCFIIFYNIGLSTVPFAIMSEIFSTHIKSKALSIFAICNAILLFIIAILYQIIANQFGNSFIFLFFGICTFITFIFIWFYVPETKGKSLDNILIELNQSKSKKYNNNNNIEAIIDR